jgi:hypothetical protein
VHDWVFVAHKTNVKSAFELTDKKGNVQPVSTSENFATALEQQNDDFRRIRGIANAKHLGLRRDGIRPVSNAPSHAANTATQTGGNGAVGYDAQGI